MNLTTITRAFISFARNLHVKALRAEVNAAHDAAISARYVAGQLRATAALAEQAADQLDADATKLTVAAAAEAAALGSSI